MIHLYHWLWYTSDIDCSFTFGLDLHCSWANNCTGKHIFAYAWWHFVKAGRFIKSTPLISQVVCSERIESKYFTPNKISPVRVPHSTRRPFPCFFFKWQREPGVAPNFQKMAIIFWARHSYRFSYFGLKYQTQQGPLMYTSASQLAIVGLVWGFL